MVKSASKFMSLNMLYNIRDNSYRTKCGAYEYSSYEIEDQISSKETKAMLEEHDRQIEEMEAMEAQEIK